MPVHARSLGSSLLGVIDNLSLFVMIKTAPALSDYLGLHGSFYFYSAITALCTIICYFTLPDTTGMSLEQIEDMYRTRNRKMLNIDQT